MAAGVHLVGGGWDEAVRDEVYGPFLAEAGRGAVVACLVVDEGDGAEQAQRWASVLAATGPCAPRPVLVPLGSVLDLAALDGCDALLVCGGLTPAYADALAPVAGGLRSWCADRPYLGFSAGAAVAAGQALVGGWRSAGRAVCPEDAGEDVDEVRVTAGVGLVDLAVDVHAAQWGTLGRLVAAVRTGAVTAGVALDEGTVLRTEGGRGTVRGSGAVHLVTAPDAGVGRAAGQDGMTADRVVTVRALTAGATVPVGQPLR